MGTGSFPGVESDRGVTLTPHPLLVPRSKNRISLRAFVTCKRGETYLIWWLLIPVAVRSKAWFCGSSLAGTSGSNLAGGWMSVYCKCCALSGRESASGWSPVQRSPTEYGVSEYDREASTMRRPWPIRGSCAKKKIVDGCCLLWYDAV
jgi:hypothetical protein